MTKELLRHINEEARSYAEYRCFSSSYKAVQEFHAAVGCYIRHLWHERSDKPAADRPLLLHMVPNYGSRYKIGSYGRRGNDECFVADCSRIDDYVLRWAYMEDLFE